MPVLEAATNLNPVHAANTAAVAVVDSTALMPQEGPSGTIADIEKPRNASISVYVVRNGDTLTGIAALFGVPLNTILWANDLTKSSHIKTGDKLTILPVPGIPYVLKKGDTLASIAKRYGGDAFDIGSFNGIDDSSLTPGTQIIIPDGELSDASIAAASKPSSTQATASKSKTTKQASSISTKVSISSASVSASASISDDESTGTAKYGPEPAHNVGPQGTSAQISYYTSPLAHYVKTQGIHGYNAVDLAAPTGTSIMAAADGEVIVAKEGGWNGGYGSYVVIQHDNGSQTLYAHMSRVDVSAGDTISQGDVIGAVGSTGEATGPHVHFEIRNGIRNPF